MASSLGFRSPLAGHAAIVRHATAALLPLAVAAFPLASGCARSLSAPNLGDLYGEPARYHSADRNPVIVIPGILGSKLRQAGTNAAVWGAFTPDAADPTTAEGARLVGLPMRTGAKLSELTDDVEPAGVLDRVKLQVFGLPISVRAYANILATLGVGGYRDELLGRSGAIDYGGEHYTCFQFDYDWRRDNVENARRLHEFILSRRNYVCGKIKERFRVERDNVRFDIVAHSMGGLVARYYLMYGGADLPDEGPIPAPSWEGAKHVERVVLVGTPNAGSAEAVIELVNGADFGAVLPAYPPAVLGTMPSIYQLLPRSRHRPLVSAVRNQPVDVDSMSPETWETFGWGLADPAADRWLSKLLPEERDPARRREIALDHQRKCLARAVRFAAALDQPATPPDPVQLYLFAGDAKQTPQTVAVPSGGGPVTVAAYGPGDGTVVRSSALLDERMGRSFSPELKSPIPWRQVTFLFDDHIGLTRDPAFTDNVLYLLLERPGGS